MTQPASAVAQALKALQGAVKLRKPPNTFEIDRNLTGVWTPDQGPDPSGRRAAPQQQHVILPSQVDLPALPRVYLTAR